MIGKLTIEIDDNITEQGLVENCLNQIASGYNPSMTLAFYAMGKKWHGDKLIYYLGLIQREIAVLTERKSK